jgi:NTE family protein
MPNALDYTQVELGHRRKPRKWAMSAARCWLIPVAIACLLACAVAVQAEPGAERPRIGLALSGGGAKGGAHAGVLEVLEEMRVPIDCIAGTSVGAMVGGGYASGLSAAELRAFVLNVDWPGLVSGVGHRERAPMERKQAEAGFSNELEFGISRRKLVMPGRVVPSTDLESLLRKYVAQTHATTDFDQLPIPFRAVATDMLSGEPIAIASGDLATAMYASMAVPGAFSPVVTEEHVLVDGGLVRNLPVDVARALCADIVIAVTLMEQPATHDDLRSAGQLAFRAMNLMVDANTRAQQRTLTERDINIQVWTGDVLTPDFDRVVETVPMGVDAARAVAHRLEALSLSPEQYAAWRAEVAARDEARVRLAGLRYEGLQRVNPEFLATYSRLRAGDEVNIARISQEALRLSELGEFDAVDYRLEGDPAAPTLVWRPREKPWGPDYFVADFGLHASKEEIPSFVLYGRHTRTWLNPRGGEWRNQAQLGRESLVSTSLYQPVDVAQLYFVEPVLGYVINWQNLYVGDEREATYRTIDLDVGLDVGMNLGREAQLRVGYGHTNRRFDRVTGLPLLPQDDVRDGVVWIGIRLDSHDLAFIPTEGTTARLDYQRSHESLGANREWERAELGVSIVTRFRGDALVLGLDAGTDFGSGLPLDRGFSIGGPASFPGLRFGELRTPEYWSASASYIRRVRDLMPMFDQALYFGTRLQAGWFADDYALLDDEHVYSLAFFMTVKSFAGPMTIGAAATTSNAWGLWLALGREIGGDSVMGRGVFR